MLLLIIFFILSLVGESGILFFSLWIQGIFFFCVCVISIVSESILCRFVTRSLQTMPLLQWNLTWPVNPLLGLNGLTFCTLIVRLSVKLHLTYLKRKEKWFVDLDLMVLKLSFSYILLLSGLQMLCRAEFIFLGPLFISLLEFILILSSSGLTVEYNLEAHWLSRYKACAMLFSYISRELYQQKHYNTNTFK